MSVFDTATDLWAAYYNSEMMNSLTLYFLHPTVACSLATAAR